MALAPATPLADLDLGDPSVRGAIRELLPAIARAELAAGEAPSTELVEDARAQWQADTLADLVLDVAILLTEERPPRDVEVDTSRVRRVPVGRPIYGAGSPWARLAFDFRRPDWTVAVSLEPPPRGEPLDVEGVAAIFVRKGLDLRPWLSGMEEWIGEWYREYQLEGRLYSAPRLGELHERLAEAERHAWFLVTPELLPEDPAPAARTAAAIREAGGAASWACAEFDNLEPQATIFTADGSDEPEAVIAELTAGAERLLRSVGDSRS